MKLKRKQSKFTREWVGYTLPIIILGLAIIGALLQNTYILYALIFAICTVVILVVWNKINERYYPYLVFAIGLALLYQTTLIGPGLVGSDIHTEYYFYNKALDGWNIAIPHSYNSAIGTTLLAPFLTKVFHISGYWVYKAVFPFLFAFVPVLLYFIYKKEFGAKVALLSSFFFVAIPTWMLEMIGLPRQMLAEIMFASCLFLILVPKWGLRIKVPLLIVCSILGAMFHYVIGPAMWLYLGLGCLLLLFFKDRVFPVKWLALVTAILLIVSIGYYSVVAQGVPLTSLEGYSYSQLNRIIHSIPPRNPLSTPILEPLPGAPTVPVPPSGPPTKASEGYFMSQEPMIRAALGLDFMEVDALGKTFRVFQYLTEICIILGCIQLVRHRKKYSTEYLSFCGVAIFLLAACILLPKFSSMLNATRFYHLALFLLAPTLVLGGQLISRNLKVLTLCLIIPYFLFTSGFIFEVTKQPNIQTINIPYSIALSNYRVGLTGISTKNDIKVRDWAVDNNLGSICADINGCLLFCERVSLDWSINWKGLTKTEELTRGDYIFLSERNNATRMVTFQPVTEESPTGIRVSLTYEEVGLDKIIKNGKVLYQAGNAMILEIGE